MARAKAHVAQLIEAEEKTREAEAIRRKTESVMAALSGKKLSLEELKRLYEAL